MYVSTYPHQKSPLSLKLKYLKLVVLQKKKRIYVLQHSFSVLCFTKLVGKRKKMSEGFR